MGSRKRAKPNPKAEAAGLSKAPKTALSLETISLDQETPQELHAPTTQINGTEGNKDTDRGSVQPQDGVTGTPRSTSSWYGGGTWPKAPKAAPLTQVAKESISSTGRTVSDALGPVTPGRSREFHGSTTPLSLPSLYLSRNLGGSSRSLPLSATTTKVNISSSVVGNEANGLTGLQSEEKLVDDKPEVDRKTHRDKELVCQHAVKAGDDNNETRTEDFSGAGRQSILEEQSQNQTSWLGWFSRADGISKAQDQPTVDSDEAPKIKEQIQRRNSEPSLSHPDPKVGQLPRSWLAIWGKTAGSKDKASLSEIAGGSDARILEASLEPQHTVRGKPESNNDAVISSGWAFWSRGNSRVTPLESIADPAIGELAVAGSKSQSKPENAVVDVGNGIPTGSGKPAKRERPRSLEVTEDNRQFAAKKAEANGNLGVAVQPPNRSTVPKRSPTTSTGPPNLVLPSVKQTYRYEDSPGLFQQLGRYFYPARALTPRHVSLLKNPQRIKRALAIGIHGYFPAPLIRTVLGQPTGTSIKFADSAASAIQKWTEAQGYSCETEKIALEGEGKIEERVDLLWKLLLNWIDDIRKSDFILVACHSQGVPVAMMLVAKLISFGCVNGARVGICAMAGVNLGPFVDYKSRWISGSAGELFDFARPDSQVSKDHEAALERVLDFGVKIVYIGSIDDQLVSLEVSFAGRSRFSLVVTIHLTVSMALSTH